MAKPFYMKQCSINHWILALSWRSWWWCSQVCNVLSWHDQGKLCKITYCAPEWKLSCHTSIIRKVKQSLAKPSIRQEKSLDNIKQTSSSSWASVSFYQLVFKSRQMEEFFNRAQFFLHFSATFNPPPPLMRARENQVACDFIILSQWKDCFVSTEGANCIELIKYSRGWWWWWKKNLWDFYQKIFIRSNFDVCVCDFWW